MLLIKKKLFGLLNSKKYYNNYYYTKSISKYKDINSYINIYEDFLSSNDIIKTSERISHSSNISFGTDISTAKKEIGTPYKFIKNLNLCDILFYKTKISNYKIDIELHFFKKKLVFYKYTFPFSFYTKEIENQVQNKYFKGNKLIDFKNQLIADANNSFLKIDNEVSFSIYYFSLNHGFYDYLKNQKEILKFHSLNKQRIAVFELLETL
ncbi:hypothetical protein C7447_1011088 [Tenacibaculum adriaticum]|uniref:Uncharacterized protein n=1 Tax=Tenacibaculum adriaticum TaxID=413713 RepID=A0A5S5DX96_9FLAO|nr:hypothetical protein [Tenacibaculum adriaticum]TYQ00472.1 hypothetical protein C7447_1011088 [Tenacibaculum adriaticum]